MLVITIEHGGGPNEPIVFAAELDVGGRLRGEQRLNVGLIIVHAPASKEPARHIKREPLRYDVPGESRIARPLGHQGNLVAGKRALAESCVYVGHPAAHTRRVIDLIKRRSFPTHPLRRIEISVDAKCRQKMNLVLQLHQIDAGLEAKLSQVDADATLYVPRRLCLQIEVRNDEYERAAGSDSFVGIG